MTEQHFSVNRAAELADYNMTERRKEIVKQTDVVHVPGRPGLLEFYAWKAEDEALNHAAQYALFLEAKLDALMDVFELPRQSLDEAVAARFDALVASGLDAYMKGVWKRSGRDLCANCGRPIYRDHDSGYYIHAGHGDVDGRNGLFCAPEMWDDASIRRYAVPLGRQMDTDTPETDQKPSGRGEI